MAGRPTKYTPERAQHIKDALRAGNTRTASVLSCGIAYSTFLDWLEAYPHFASDIEKAEAEAEMRKVRVIDEAAEVTWQAAAWWLERRRSKDYGRTLKEVSGPDGGPIPVAVQFTTEDALDIIKRGIVTEEPDGDLTQ